MKNKLILLPLIFFMSNAFSQALPNNNNVTNLSEYRTARVPLTISGGVKVKAQSMGVSSTDPRLTATTNAMNKVLANPTLSGAITGMTVQCVLSTCNANSLASTGISWGVTTGTASYCSIALAGGPATGFMCLAGGAVLGYLAGKVYNLGYQMVMGDTKFQVQIPQTASATTPVVTDPNQVIPMTVGTPMVLYGTTLQVSSSELLPTATNAVGIECTNFSVCVGLQRLNYVTLQNAMGATLRETTTNYNQEAPDVGNILNTGSSYYYYLYFNGGGIGDINAPSISGYRATPSVNCASGILYGGTCMALSSIKDKATIKNPSSGGSTGTPTGTTTFDVNSLTDLINALPSDYLKQKVDPQLVADIANGLWKQASQLPGYDGLPYPSTDPLTAPEIAAAAALQPGGMPRVGDALAPASSPSSLAIPDPVTGKVIDPNTGKATDPDTGKVTDPATNPNPNNGSSTTVDPNGNVSVTVNTNVNVDWGSNNGVQGTIAEETPTMGNILDPIFALVKPWTDFKLATQGGTCPVYSFNIFNKDISVDAVCSVMEPHRSTLQTIGLLMFTLISIFIILGA